MYKCCKGKIYDHNNLMEKCHHVNVKGQNDKKNLSQTYDNKIKYYREVYGHRANSQLKLHLQNLFLAIYSILLAISVEKLH